MVATFPGPLVLRSHRVAFFISKIPPYFPNYHMQYLGREVEIKHLLCQWQALHLPVSSEHEVLQYAFCPLARTTIADSGLRASSKPKRVKPQ